MNLSQGVLEKSVQFIKGVGPKKAKIFKKLDVLTLRDLLYYFPHRYEDRGNFSSINKLKIGQIQAIKVSIKTSGLRFAGRRLAIFELAASDETGSLMAVWFNQPYLKDKLTAGSEVILYGKVDIKKGRLTMISPEYEVIAASGVENSIHAGRIVPVYSLTFQMNQRYIRATIKSVVDLHAANVFEALPQGMRTRLKLPHISTALKNIHFPKNEDFYSKAKRRLIFDEFFLIEIANAYRKKKINESLRGIKHGKKRELDESFSKIAPFELTVEQKKAICEIQGDMMSKKPMYRILHGEVGSGKTIVALYAILLSISNGHQAALMVPTEILAEQHFSLFKTVFSGRFPYKVALMRGGMRAFEKKQLYQDIKDKKIDLVIGTHAIIQKGIKFKKLSLCVIDEQHKFGVLQRKALKEKGVNSDILVMTATPIPRTLSMVLYSDMDISVIRQLPAGRKLATTWWVSEKKRMDAYAFIRKEINGVKKQAYIVYPIIEESEKLDLRDAVRMYKYLKKDVFSEFRVGIIHGRLEREEKERVMREFKDKKIDILVSTVLIEAGIDMPDASIMLIEHAERFGLAQLHQLRGRVGRGNFKAYCILVSNAKTDEAKLRMNALVKCRDGFELAEKDLKIRGPGEFFGVKQHGFDEFKIACPQKDVNILKLAQKEAFALIDEDPLLTLPRHKQLLNCLKGKFDLI